MTVSAHSKLKNKHGHKVSLPKPDLKLFVKDVDDPHGRKRPLTVKTWATVKDVKDSLQKLLHIPSSSQRLYVGPLLTPGHALPNHRSLEDAGIYRNGETLYLEIKGMCSAREDFGFDSARAAAANSTSITSSITTLKSNTVNDICISKSCLDLTPKPLRRIIQQARRGITLGLKPDLVLDGSGGTYFLHDARKVRVAVFKPADEEPYAENNPRGYVRQGASTSTSDYRTAAPGHGTGTGPGPAYDNNYSYDYSNMGIASDSMSMRAGIIPGEACLREVAAYILDHDSFSGVPMTTLTEARHPAFHSNGSMLKLSQGGAALGNHSLQLGSSSTKPPETLKKVGSCQEYVNGECSMDDLSPSKISVDEVHKIAVLDIRIMNADRNSANLICRRKPQDPDFFELFPIDHGYCLRTVADVSWFDWCWLDWPQMKQPISKKTRSYILNLDIEKDARMLKERLNIPERALDYFRASTKLLQEGVRCGLTLYDIAILCCRNDDSGELPSKLETLMNMADEISKSAVDNGRWHHVAASKALEQQLSPNYNSCSLTTDLSKTSRSGGLSMFKSKSFMNFSSSFRSENSGSSTPPTPMAQSSGSDSSSTSADIEPSMGEEECEEWAATIIADKLEPVSKSKPLSGSTRQRSISIARWPKLDEDEASNSSSSSSDLSSSSGGGGFWFVSPTASSQPKVEDDNSATWSPYTSPALSPICPELCIDKRLDQEELGLNGLRIVKFGNNILIPPRDSRPSTTVAAALLSPERRDTIESENMQDTEHVQGTEKFLPGGTNKPSSFLDIGQPRAEGKGISRSQSYSAFSSFSRFTEMDESVENSRSKQQPRGQSTEQTRHYFHKFIDLLIDREITPIIRNRQN